MNNAMNKNKRHLTIYIVTIIEEKFTTTISSPLQLLTLSNKPTEDKMLLGKGIHLNVETLRFQDFELI